jgi:Asp-tRNA(Asn)/Glu-tRNA(Gln) amidotransferase A subunit family amidase
MWWEEMNKVKTSIRALDEQAKRNTASVLAAVDHCLARVADREASVGAWAYIDPAAARRQAEALDRQSVCGPLHGLPVGIKDVLLTRDMPTRYNCDLYVDHAPQIDAAAVAILRRAGAVLMGKTETVELASIGRPARTVNPHALTHTPGGSSSGSAAAVADGHVPVAMGTQTGGSIIRPASFCGTWALKPTWGIVSTEGAKPFSPSLDTIGWFTRSPEDLGLLLGVFEPAPRVSATAISDARIAVWRTAGWPRAETATRSAMTAAIEMLQSAGACVVELDVPKAFDGLAAAHRTIMFAEGARSFLADYLAGSDKLHPRIQEMVTTGGGSSSAALAAAHDLAGWARAEFDSIARRYDAILMPSTIAEAPKGLESTGDLLFNGLLTLLHVPCVNMPLWRAANGLPVGLTLTGPRHADHRVIAMAQSIAALAAGQSPAAGG